MFPARQRVALPTALLIAMPAVALVAKCLLIVHTLGGSDARIVETGFGFGAYVRSLLTDGSFRSCGITPFAGCDPNLCVYATRMPLLPMLYAGLAKVVGTKSVAVAIAKSTLSAGLLTIFLFSLTRDRRFSLFAVALAYALYLGPQVLKHGASLEYEEGLLVDLEACLVVAAVYLIEPAMGDSGKRARMAFAAVLLATALYFIKTTALGLLVVIMAMVLRDPQLKGRLKVISLLCVLGPFAAWAAHNYGSSGEVHLSSSWNGENLYRGSSAEGFALYPEVLLDRLFDSRSAKLSDGHVVPLHDLRNQQCFVNEWVWNGYYGGLARSWSLQHPLEALQYAGRKAWVSLVELRHTPYRQTSEGPDTEYPPAISTVMFVWMGFARVIFVVLLVCVAHDLWRGRAHRPLWTMALIGAGWLPYMVVFAYQRHVVPLLLMAGLLLLTLYVSEAVPRAGPGAANAPPN